MKAQYLLFYLPACLRLIFCFGHDNFWGLRALNRGVGRLELYFGWLRDYFFIVCSLVVLGKRIAGWVEWGLVWTWPMEVVFLSLTVYSRWWRWHGLAVLHELARANPLVHPTEFFEHLYGRLGFLPHRVPEKAARLIDPDHLDFRKGRKPRKSFWLLLRGVYNTYLFATLAYKAFRWKGVHYIRTAGSGLSIVWATRIAQIARMQATVERHPELEATSDGKILFALNHTSFFDFCLAPLAYRQENRDGSAKSFIPSIMVAKDHFKDNFFLYRVIGIGRVLEALGMIFVDRKSKEKAKAERVVRLTVNRLLASDIPLAIYPQGTRARGQLDRYGQRWDAAYFCVGKKNRLIKESGHFKKGVAYIAVELAEGLVKHRLGGKVFVVPVAIAGTGTACPKGSLKVQTEAGVSIKLGEPIRIHPGRRAEELSREIDLSLQTLLGVRTRLERRFFTDLRELLDSQGAEEVAVAFKEWRDQGNLIYTIIDCIYALPKKHWRGLLMELAHTLRTHESKESLVAVQAKVAQYF